MKPEVSCTSQTEHIRPFRNGPPHKIIAQRKKGSTRILTDTHEKDFGCVAIGSAVLFILRSRLLLYSVGSGGNRVQVVLSGFNVRLFCFVQVKTLCRYCYMYVLAALVPV